MLTFDHVTKRYQGKDALGDVTLSFEPGKTYALAGPNGSGKSTLMKIAAGLVKPDGGRAKLDGDPIGPKTKQRIAYMSTENFYYDYMTIALVGAFYRDFFKDFDEKIFDTLLDFFELSRDMRIKALSSGMAAKLKLAATLSRRADVVMLDEPLNGVDVLGRDQVRTAIERTAAPGRTLILSSHLLDELEEMAVGVVMIKKGEIALSGDIQSIRDQRGQSIVEIYKEIFASTVEWGKAQ